MVRARLKTHLQDKSRWQPAQMVTTKMPDGTAELAELPRRKADAVEGDEVAVRRGVLPGHRACAVR